MNVTSLKGLSDFEALLTIMIASKRQVQFKVNGGEVWCLLFAPNHNYDIDTIGIGVCAADSLKDAVTILSERALVSP